MRLGKLLLLVVVLASALVASGCKQTKALLTPEPIVVTKEATVAVPAAAVEGELPADAPESIPLWPGSKIISAESTGDATFTMMLGANEVFEDVVSGMSVGFERAGWKVVETGADEGLAMLEVADDKYEGVVTIASQDDTVTIDFLLTPVSQ